MHICRDFFQPASAQPQHLFAYSCLRAPRATCSFPSLVTLTSILNLQYEIITHNL